jgi:hypothetical protein
MANARAASLSRPVLEKNKKLFCSTYNQWHRRFIVLAPRDFCDLANHFCVDKEHLRFNRPYFKIL